MIASPCCVCANSKTRPPGRAASMAVRIRELPPTAKITASAPRPSVSSRTRCTTSVREASIQLSSPKLLPILSLSGYKSEVIKLAPARRANTLSMMPIGPCPMASTVSPACNRKASIPFMQVFTGSTKQACSKETPSGIRTVPRSTIQSSTRTYSANPPPEGSNPAVQPTFL